MKIETLHEQGSGKQNEDSLLNEAPLFGVFDGATGLEPFTNAEGKSGAALASSIARDTFLGSTKPLRELALEANQKIALAMQAEGIDLTRKTALWATTAAVFRIGENSFDWIQLSDSLILVLMHDGTYKIYTEGYEHDLETLLMWKDLAEKKTENIRTVLDAQMKKVRNEANITYGGLNGEVEMEKFLYDGTSSLEGVASIIAFTDGLFIPKEDPRKGEDFALFCRLFKEGGLKNVGGYVRALEDSDPNCWKYPRFKMHDDMTAVAVSFE